jgi:alkanesulfonate monooxygenase SsuD/methylene tetrahydromethanopterin reductase-like flavin-dependent oxidoreductase (luciferase family)
VIFQAGGSGRGREFAAQHAEAILSNQNSTRGMKEFVVDIRQRAQKYDRQPRILFSIQPVLGDTPAAARENEKALFSLATTPAYFEGGLARASTSLGIDLAKLELDTPVKDQLHKVNRGDKGESILFQYFKARPETTPRDMGVTEAIKITLPIVGTAEQVADRLCEIVDDTDADGFLIREAFLPSYIADIVDRLVPALQRRGRMRTEYAGKTFREHLNEY